MSPVISEPRWTPPIPPVAKTEIPAACASATVAETVVTPTSQPCACATARSRSATLRVPCSTRFSSSAVRPTCGRPSRIAVTAGVAPWSRTACLHSSRASAFAGAGSPRFEKIVDSRATTARPSARACATSSDKMTRSVTNSSRFVSGHGQCGAGFGEDSPGEVVAGLDRLDTSALSRTADRNPAANASPAPVVSRTSPTGGTRTVAVLVAGEMDLGGLHAVLHDDRRTRTGELSQGADVGLGSVREEVRRLQRADRVAEESRGRSNR